MGLTINGEYMIIKKLMLDIMDMINGGSDRIPGDSGVISFTFPIEMFRRVIINPRRVGYHVGGCICIRELYRDVLVLFVTP